jgi:uncharacterized protein YerC
MNRFIDSSIHCMPQVSKYRLDTEIEKLMFQKFWLSIALLHDASTVSSFFSDLLSDTENIMLAKRFAIAVLLSKGKRPVDIKSTLHVTYSTICSVSSWIKNARPQTRVLLHRMIEQSDWQAFIDELDALLDELPPAYRTNWSQAGKEKWVRRKKRSARRFFR